MKNYKYITIGINQYHCLQPLSYATADAMAIHLFLVEEAGVAPEQCLLLSDTSAWVEDKSTYPSRSNILKWLDVFNYQHPHLLPQKHSTLWFFFSGYGVNYNGEDYLMPIDGNPTDIVGTGIQVRSLFEALKSFGDTNILVFLDFNRSSGMTGGQPVGKQTLDLAREMEIAAVLSTSKDEFSHEAAALGHGIFTAALLEAFRYYQENINLAYLDEYLRDRIPELSEHYWRPVQNPVIISPTLAASQSPILPLGSVNSMSTLINNTIPIQEWHEARREENNAQLTTFPHATFPTIDNLEAGRFIYEVEPKTPWLKWLLWGGSVTLFCLLILKFLGFENIRKTTKPEVKTTEENSITSPPNAYALLEETTDEYQKLLSSSKSSLRFLQASNFNRAIGEAQKIKSDDPLYQQAQSNIARWSQVILDIANGRAAVGNYTGAIAAAKLVPKEQFSAYTQAQVAIERWKIKAFEQRRTQHLIEAATKLLQPNQASSYNRAIMMLRQVTPQEVGYDQVQELINQWSEQIYLIANSRAARGDFELAIETVKLVPTDTSSGAAAMNSSVRWQQGIR
ncbi:MAG: caspase family protein [Gomphosphaeria aponina SAG 52.96 = DSM 107014]|uniref:Caspase family protein n=1 Tax=Gomphosphaeria aponina SAG 52.96 = DSM 107014 TaxID=1521640 RepID=A0A941JTB8_9CHRO|nr:caspase family protein [Gomphosphaeria aponina SAG 52.96 = DSM 107014]